jgi:O-antigen ligase
MIRKAALLLFMIVSLAVVYWILRTVAQTDDLFRFCALLTGVVVGSSLTIMFLTKPRIAILTYVLIFPTLQIVMHEVVPIPGSGATVAIGGPLQAIILLAGIYLLPKSHLRISRTPVAWLYLLLVLIMGVSILGSADKIRAIKEWGRIGSFAVIYLLAMDLFRDEKDMSKYLTVLFLSLIVPMFFSAYQLYTRTGYISELETQYNRIMGTFGNPNEYAMFMNFPLLLSITMFLDKEIARMKRGFFMASGLLLLVSLFLTYTRASWFGVLAGLLVIGYKRNRSLLFLLPVFAACVVFIVGLQSIRLGEFSTGELVFSGRLWGWKNMLPLVLNKPVLGHGLTDFGDVATQSDHVRLLLETGVVGWLVFVLLLSTVLINVNRNYSAATSPLERNFLLAFLAYMVCVAVVGFAETNTAFQWYVWIPAGIALSRSATRKAERATSYEPGTQTHSSALAPSAPGQASR